MGEAGAGLRITGSASRGRLLFWMFGASLLVLGSVGVSAIVPPLIISEFRVRGPAGANDEFIEIYNNSDSAHTVATSDGSSGYAVVASDAVTRHVIANGIVLPARSHYLVVNSAGYSLAAYPASSTVSATGNGTYTTDIPDNAGIAIFATSNPANFTLANRMDAVGSTSEANTLYKEGPGYPALTPFSIDYSFYRSLCPVTASCSGQPLDTDTNATDFVFVDTNGTSAGAGQRLGAPAPENATSPIRLIPSGAPAVGSLLPAATAAFAVPNFARDLTSSPGINSTFGQISIRRQIVNNSGVPITRLRFRIIDINTFPSASGVADLRPITSSDFGGGGFVFKGTRLEQPPSQPNGGGFGSTLSADSVTTKTPLPPGVNIYVQFVMGIQQTGTFRFTVVIETLPALTSAVFTLSGTTEGAMLPATNDLIISEFRVRGPSGATDEFVEIHNTGVGDHVVGGFDNSGYALVASDGVTRFTIPNGTLIPAHGHFLGVNSVAYSLAAYPAGNGTTATGDATFTTDIPDNAGLALFRTSIPANLVLANRFDAVGATSVPSLYKEGTGHPVLTPFSIDYSFYRTIPVSGLGAGYVTDTDDNAADFLFVDTNGTSAGAGQRLGAPGPQNLSSPTGANCCGIAQTRLDAAQPENAAPNLVFNPTSNPGNNSTFGTLSVRRTFTNQTGAPITRLRFRVVDQTTFPSPTNATDLRPITSGDVVVQRTDLSLVTVRGTNLEQPPPAQPNGGGFNSSLSAGIVTFGTPLANNASVSVQFLLGLQQTGCHRFAIHTESLPAGWGAPVFNLVSPPTGLVVTATTPISVSLAWVPNPCQTFYDVYRSDTGTNYSLLATVGGAAAVDSPLSPGTSHLYAVRPNQTFGDYSIPDLVTMIIFTDPTLTPGSTPVKAAHVTELRTAVNSVRALAGLGAGSFTDPSLVVGTTPIKAVHISDLRTALNAARTILGLALPGYTDPVLTPPLTSIKAAHVVDLRNGVK